MIGTTIGSYRITSELGEGGMGVVYRATETLLDREVALKALHPQITRDESRLQRFQAEAKALARLLHPNIATLFNFFEQNGVYYMVMEFIDGQTLEDVVRQNGALPLRPALEIFNSGLRGFGHAHERGVIHRDIKPSNLMLTREGEVKITDFGIARVAGGGKLTQTGKLIGTLEYMSPEQVQGQEQDARSDIYSLGILLFELVTGRMPWTATSDFDIMRAHLEVPAPPARSLIAELPPALDAVITRALAKKPDDRFQSVREMREDLEKIVAALPATKAAVFPLVAPTRVADAPFAAPAPTVDANETRVGVAAPPAPAHSAPTRVPVAATSLPKWLWPAVGGAGVVLLLAFFAFASRRSNVVAPPQPTPTNVPAIVSNATETPEPTPLPQETEKPEVIVPSGGVGNPNLAPTPQINSSIKIPQNLPGLAESMGDPTPAPTAQPTAKPTPRLTARPTPEPTAKPRAVVRPKPKPRRTKPKIVEHPKPRIKPRAVTRPRPKPRPVARPRSKPKSSGSSEQARLRALIKGN